MASAPATNGIVTPEAVVLEFETAGLGSRMISGFLDMLVQLVLLLAVVAGAGVVVGFGGGFGAAAAYVLVFFVLFGYPALLETLWRGRTLGKAALGLRVVTVEGAPIRFRHAAIRSILGLIDKWVTQGTVGVVVILLTKRNQRLGDLVAGTIVLRERTGARAPQPVQFAPPPGLEGYAATLDVAALTHAEYQTVRSFLLRAPTLPPDVRWDLARTIAQSVLGRVRTPPLAGMHPETFLVCVAAAFQRRAAGGARNPTVPVFESVWATPTVRYQPEAAPPPGPAAVADAGGYAPPG